MASIEVGARDFQSPISLRARCIADLVVVAPEIAQRNMRPNIHVPEKPEAFVRGKSFINFSYTLDLGMIWRYTKPDQAERHRQPFEHIDLDCYVPLFKKTLDHVERSGTRADDGDAQRTIRISQGTHDCDSPG